MAAKRARAAGTRTAVRPHPAGDVRSILTQLQKLGTKSNRDNLGPRYGIHVAKPFGVSIGQLKILAKKLGRSHELAAGLWESGWYEARLLATMVDEPERVTTAQMDRWCREFDNWGICDTACFVLFDRTPHAWKKVESWARRSAEFEKRAAFALLWSLTVHDKKSGDAPFLRGLERIEEAALDERHFVKKAVNMALRAVGKRSPALHAAATEVAARLAGSPHPAPRWVGKDALRELASPSVKRRLAARRRPAAEKRGG